MWRNVAPKIQTQGNKMIHNLRRRNPVLNLLTLKQGFSACGLSLPGLSMTRGLQWANGLQVMYDLKGPGTENGRWEKRGEQRKENKGHPGRKPQVLQNDWEIHWRM